MARSTPCHVKYRSGLVLFTCHISRDTSPHHFLVPDDCLILWCTVRDICKSCSDFSFWICYVPCLSLKYIHIWFWYAVMSFDLLTLCLYAALALSVLMSTSPCTGFPFALSLQSFGWADRVLKFSTPLYLHTSVYAYLFCWNLIWNTVLSGWSSSSSLSLSYYFLVVNMHNTTFIILLFPHAFALHSDTFTFQPQLFMLLRYFHFPWFSRKQA